MKLLLLSLCLFLLACTVDREEEAYDLIISNVNLIDGTGTAMQRNVDVGIKDQKIASIDAEKIKQSTNRIDGTDKYLIPGLFDCHVHTTFYQADFRRLMHYGVTSILVPGGSTCTDQYYADMRALGNQDSIPAPRVFHTSQHFTMEGRHPVKTYASSNWVEGETVFYMRDSAQIKTLLKNVTKQSIVGIKLTIEDGPAPPFVERMPQAFIDLVTAEAKQYDLEIFAHVSDNIELSMALQAGVQNVIHFTGVDLDWDRDQAMLDSIFNSGISWVTTLMLDKSFVYPLHPEWLDIPEIQEIYDSLELENLQDPSYADRANGYVSYMKEYLDVENPTLKDFITFQVADIQMLYDNGVNMVLGTDTGNDFIFPGYSLHEEMQLMELGGMQPIDIIKMGTKNAAQMLKVEDTHGTIEPGKFADMILLNKNPLDAIGNTLSIHRVFKNGQLQERMN